MTLVLNGTTGVSAVDGSASTPALQGNDSNTGVYFPAANSVAISVDGIKAEEWAKATYEVQYLVVAGGGSGGNGGPGGGGAGGMLEGIATVTSGTGYTFTLGAGGTYPGTVKTF